MHGSVYTAVLGSRVSKYSDTSIKESLNRNSHMNNYDDEKFDEEEAKQFLFNFVEHFCHTYEGGKSGGEVCKGLVTAAIQFLDKKTFKVKESTSGAILTDFINYVAGQQGMDYGLYSSDLGC